MRAEVTSLYTDNDLGLMVVCTVLDGSIKINDTIPIIRDGAMVGTAVVLNIHKFGRQTTEAKAGNDYYSLMLATSSAGVAVDDMLESV